MLGHGQRKLSYLTHCNEGKVPGKLHKSERDRCTRLIETGARSYPGNLSVREDASWRLSPRTGAYRSLTAVRCISPHDGSWYSGNGGERSLQFFSLLLVGDYNCDTYGVPLGSFAVKGGITHLEIVTQINS